MLVNLKKKTNSFDYFFQRFENGRCIAPHLPRITTEESAKQFQPRDNGLKVLLINPSIREWSFPNIEPMNFAYIAGSAIVDGHKVYILDLNGERKKPVEDIQKYHKYSLNRIEEEINKIKPDIIGIGGIITQYAKIKEMTSFCKKIAPETPIVLGGGISTPIPEFCLKRLDIDYIVLEEGETTFSELLFRIENKLDLKNCLGVGHKDKNGNIIINEKRPSVIDGEFGLDCLNWPIRHLFDVENTYKVNPTGHLNYETKWRSGELKKEFNGKYSLSLVGTRGCVYSQKACNFCYVSYLGKTYRKRTVRDVVDEMEYLKNRYNLSYIHFLDDLLLTEIDWTLDFFSELKNRKNKTGFEVEWGGTARTNIVYNDKKRAEKQNRKHMMELGYEVGWRQGCFGVESASPTILHNIDKSGQTQETIAWVAKEAKKIFGYFDASFIVGNPGETKETIIESIEFCKKNNIDVETIFFAQSFPGTKYFDEALRLGLIGKTVKGYKCEADDDIIEQYFLKLGESSQTVLTNFSETLNDEELIEMGAWATTELSSMNKRHPGLIQEPHSGDVRAKGANLADL